MGSGRCGQAAGNNEVKPDSAIGLNPVGDSGGFSLFWLFTKLLFHV